jgi:hypothetical protein
MPASPPRQVRAAQLNSRRRAQQHQGASQPSTSGQSGVSRQQAPAQQNQGSSQRPANQQNQSIGSK